jgi:hypothetical protein
LGAEPPTGETTELAIKEAHKNEISSKTMPDEWVGSSDG